MKPLFFRFLSEERGQDLVEYALLTAVVGLLAVVGFDAIRTAIGKTYASWNTQTYDISSPPDPGAGS